jgi:hypothetical protein
VVRACTWSHPSGSTSRQIQCARNQLNTALEYYVSLDGVVEEFELRYRSKKGRLVDYRYVVFKKDEVLNLGDGGPINCLWSGTYTRPGVDLISGKERNEA